MVDKAGCRVKAPVAGDWWHLLAYSMADIAAPWQEDGNLQSCAQLQ